MTRLTIVPLSTPSALGAAAQRAVLDSPVLFLQTDAHPSARWIKDAGLAYTSMDDLYGECFDFDELNDAIAARLMCDQDAVYAVPGRGPGQAQLNAIRKAAAEREVSVKLMAGAGYAEAACAEAGLAYASLVICAANDLPARIDPFVPLCVEEIDTPIRAGEVKLALGEYYPDEYNVYFCSMTDGGAYHVRSIPLYELDRQDGFFAATCCIVPPASAQENLLRGDADGLMQILRRLRAPGGCPWDAEQTHESIRSNLIEEAYEVIDAIDRQDPDALCEELGDLLLQIGLHAAMEEETSTFTLRDVATGVINKMIYRHPHVFGSVKADTSDQVLFNWENLKKKEKHHESYTEIMQAIPKGFPALMRAAKVQKKAAHAGFDWSDPYEAMYKLPEEVSELAEAMEQGDDAHIDEELGDVLFAAVNVIRLLKRDPEALLNASTDKFIARFARMEKLIAADSRSLSDMTLAQMDEYWDKAKAQMQKN
ncbi:MAG: nucleoside triphosphate pyrophosphohydrolase [Clostridia bacterium]|nr:nucleoside triphosphate pyrophosphohydrolase [Clostridia bacterium]